MKTDGADDKRTVTDQPAARQFVYIHSQKGKIQLKTSSGYLYVKEKQVNDKVYWRCTGYTTRSHCKSRMHTVRDDVVRETPHNHEPAISRNADVRPEIDPMSLEYVKCE